jgi:hypothetical protein
VGKDQKGGLDDERLFTDLGMVYLVAKASKTLHLLEVLE